MITEEGSASFGLFENKVSWKCGNKQPVRKDLGQATKGTWWMPRRSEPKKDVA